MSHDTTYWRVSLRKISLSPVSQISVASVNQSAKKFPRDISNLVKRSAYFPNVNQRPDFWDRNKAKSELYDIWR